MNEIFKKVFDTAVIILVTTSVIITFIYLWLCNGCGWNQIVSEETMQFVRVVVVFETLRIPLWITSAVMMIFNILYNKVYNIVDDIES